MRRVFPYFALPAARRDTIAEAQRRFSAFKADPNTPELDQNIQSAVFASVVRWGGETGYNDVLSVYQSTGISAIKRRALQVYKWRASADTRVRGSHRRRYRGQALAAATDPTLLQAALDFSISSEVRSQDTTTVVDRVALNPLGRVLAFDFVKQHWELFDERCVRVGGCARGCCGCWRALPCHRLRTH